MIFLCTVLSRFAQYVLLGPFTSTWRIILFKIEIHSSQILFYFAKQIFVQDTANIFISSQNETYNKNNFPILGSES